MNLTGLSFGEIVTLKRKELGVTLRSFAAQLDISPVYLCDIEKDRRTVPSGELLDKLLDALQLTEQETETMLDLLAIARNSVSADLPDYIMSKDVVRTALRAAKRYDIDDAKWLDFIKRIENETTETK